MNCTYLTYVIGGSDHKVSACNAGYLGLIPGSGRSPGEGNDSPWSPEELDTTE